MRDIPCKCRNVCKQAVHHHFAAFRFPFPTAENSAWLADMQSRDPSSHPTVPVFASSARDARVRALRALGSISEPGSRTSRGVEGRRHANQGIGSDTSNRLDERSPAFSSVFHPSFPFPLARTAVPQAPIVHNQMVLAFVHMLLQMLAEKKDASGPSFVLSLTHMVGITGMPDVVSQTKALLLVFEILKCMPEEYNRRDPGRTRRDRSTVHLQQADTLLMLELTRTVVDQCDELMDLRVGCQAQTQTPEAREAGLKVKLAALQCLRSWSEHTTLEVGWVSPTEMMTGGVLGTLKRQASLVQRGQALPAEMYVLVLQIMTDSFRSHSFFTSDPKGPPGSPEEATLCKRAFGAMARLVVGMGRIVTPPKHPYADTEEAARSACDALTTLLQLHLAPMFQHYRDRLRGTSEGESELALFRELLQLLVQFTGHRDLSGVAEPPLELWYFLPELLDWQEAPSPEARAFLAEMVPALVETIHGQCAAPRSWGEREWGLAFMNRSARKSQAGQEAAGSGEETDWDHFMDKVYFRTSANDVIEAMASTWPEKHRPGEILYTIMTRCSSDPLAIEAVLLCLTGVARGLQSGDRYYDTEDEEKGEEGEGEGEEEGGYYGYQEAEGTRGGREEDEKLREERAEQRQPALWLGVLQASTSLQDPAECFYLWRAACVLIQELAHVYLKDLAAPSLVEHVISFLIRALGHRLTGSAAALALKRVVSATCSKAQGCLEAGKEGATKQRLIACLHQALILRPSRADDLSVLATQPAAYANVVEALVLLVLATVSAVNEHTAPVLLEQLGAVTVLVLDSGPAGGRASLAQVLVSIISGVRRGGGLSLIDTLLQRAWQPIDQVIFGPLTESENPSKAIDAACRVLGACLRAVTDKATFLPLLLTRLRPLIDLNMQVLERYREALTPAAALQHGRPAPQDMSEVLLWPAPVRFLRKVLAAGARTPVEGWWPAFQGATDSLCRLVSFGLAIKIGDEDESGNQVRRQYLVDFYAELFGFMRDMILVTLDGAPPTSLLAEDPICLRRGLEVAIMALDLPLENSLCLTKALAYLEAAFRLLSEDSVVSALHDLSPRLVLALFKMLVSTANMPTNVKRATADVLYNALFVDGRGGSTRVSLLFQEALSILLASEGMTHLRSLLGKDNAAVDWLRQSFSAVLREAPVGPPKRVLMDLVKCFAGLGRNEMTLEEVRESVERNQASASIFPDLAM